MAFEILGRPPIELRDHANPSPREARVLNLDVGLDEDIGSVKVTVDTNGAVGSNTARYRIDGGSFTSDDIAADHTAAFDVALIDDTQLLEVQAQNAQGEWGSLVSTTLPIGNGKPSLSVVDGQAPGNLWSIYYEAIGVVEYSVDGGSWASPPSDPFTIAQLAASTRTAQLRCTRNGQTISHPVFIPQIPGTAPAVEVTSISIAVTNESADEFTITYAVSGTYDHVDVGWFSPSIDSGAFQSLGDAASPAAFTNSVLAPHTGGSQEKHISARIFVYDVSNVQLATATSAVLDFEGDPAS